MSATPLTKKFDTIAESDDFFLRALQMNALNGNPVVGMCPWCGESLHPGRRCSNEDSSRDK